MTDYILEEQIFNTKVYTVKNNPNILAKVYENIKFKLYEEDILKKIKHLNNTPKIIHTKDNIIFFEKIEGIDLFEYIKIFKLNEYTIKYIIFNLLHILKELYNLNIIHGDIKPENIIFNEKTKKVYLIDFEMTKGTDNYKAPETFYNNCNNYTYENNMWSVGITAYILLNNYYPFISDDNLLSGNGYIFMNYKKFSNDCIDFITSCLIYNKNKRLTIDEAINHTWFNFIPENIITKKPINCILL